MQPETVREMLVALASNYQWTWNASCHFLLDSLPGANRSIHPLLTVKELTADQLARLAEDDLFVAGLNAELDHLSGLESVGDPDVAYFSPEFGISHHAHQYAGGLGVLAGDHLKASSDAQLPLVGVGIFYHLGAFRQEIRDGNQVETLDRIDAKEMAAEDTSLVIDIPFPGRDVKAKVFRVLVGRVSVLLLNTDVDGNSDQDRTITDSLYLGSSEERVAQEMVLGVGGARALRAMGWDPGVHHLNEGHAGFAALDLIDRVIDHGDLAGAAAKVKQRVVFTTHTPVPAGITRLDRQTLLPYLDVWAERWGLDTERIWELGADPDNPSQFNMAMFCLRMSRRANGVSRLHGEVSRDLFSALPEGSEIGHITNGVHARSWASPGAQELLDETLGTGWDRGDESSWQKVSTIDDVALDKLRRSEADRLSRRLSELGIVLDPDALIVGFARRFAPYKRSTLILNEQERLIALLADDERPIHMLFAGKAHPANGTANTLLSEIVAFSGSAASNGRFSFIPDYNMEIGAALVQGCDIWLNNPIRPHEASGTSGQKVVLNGGLNLSVLDGWWAEMYDGENGWAIPSSDSEMTEQRDAEDAAGLIEVLIEARDEFYDDPKRLNDRIRHSWRTLGPKIAAARMVSDYRERLYRI